MPHEVHQKDYTFNFNFIHSYKKPLTCIIMNTLELCTYFFKAVNI